jgi:hypothetical protein
MLAKLAIKLLAGERGRLRLVHPQKLADKSVPLLAGEALGLLRIGRSMRGFGEPGAAAERGGRGRRWVAVRDSMSPA